MILWTIQPEIIYRAIMDTGVYHCDFSKSFLSDWKRQYDWMVRQMIKRLGPPPEGVTYPVWAWHTWEGARKKPDLREQRWATGWKGDRFACMEIDVSDENVLLSDFDLWSLILLDGLLCETEEENTKLEALYETLDPKEQRKMQDKNWEGAFDLIPLDNGWIIRGDSIQATFWELKREYIRSVRFFTSAVPKPDYLDEEGNIIPGMIPGV